MTAEVWFKTFEAVFAGADINSVKSVIGTICNAEYKDGMMRASEIAAAYEVEVDDDDKDLLCRGIARAIQETATNERR